MKEAIQQLVKAALQTLVDSGEFAELTIPEIKLDRTRDATHGDYASNVCHKL